MRPITALCAFVITASPCAAQQDLVAISTDGVPIHFLVHGTGEPALVLVHGWSNSQTFWEPHIERLSRSNQVVTLDLAGFGRSGAARSSWTMEAFGQDVASVLRQLRSQRAVLVGFSMGGAAVLEAARSAPELVAGVVLVDIFHNPEATYSDSAIEGIVAQFQSIWGDPVKIRAQAFSLDAPDSLVSRYLAAVPSTPPAFWWDALRNTFRWSSSRLAETLAELQVPVAAINREQPVTNVAAFRRHVPRFTVATVTGVGHLGVIWQNTEAFDRLLLDAVRRFSQ